MTKDAYLLMDQDHFLAFCTLNLSSKNQLHLFSSFSKMNLKIQLSFRCALASKIIQIASVRQTL